MTTSAAHTHSGQRGKSIAAIFAGLIVIFVLSLGIDQVLHVMKVYPPWGEPMNDPKLNWLALSYRTVINIGGCYLTAKLAPYAPMRHAMILGVIGLVLSILGLLGAMAAGGMGPLWYPILLAVSSLPCAWLGGYLYEARH